MAAGASGTFSPLASPTASQQDPFLDPQDVAEANRQAAASGKCIGVLCAAAKSLSERSKAHASCTWNGCKKCCIKHQIEFSAECKVPDHRKGAQQKRTKDSEAISTPEGGTGSFYKGPKPLAPGHYASRELDIARKEHQIHRTVTERKELEKIEGTCAEIRYFSKVRELTIREPSVANL